MEGSPIIRARGRIRKTTGKTIKKDLELEVNMSMIHSRMFWHCLIRVADPSNGKILGC